jgi:HSP20 family protein
VLRRALLIEPKRMKEIEMASLFPAPFRSGGDPFLSMQREMNRLFDEAFRGSGLSGDGRGMQGEGSFVPARMDVSETDNEIHVKVEVPGVKEDDIDVSLSDDMLTIRGEKRLEKSDEKENYHFTERSYGTFQRSLRLPYQVNPDRVRANFENGVLTVTLPKTGQKERSHRIQVQGSGQKANTLEQKSADAEAPASGTRA